MFRRKKKFDIEDLIRDLNNTTIWDELHDYKIKLFQCIKDIRWFLRIQRKLFILKYLFRKRPIMVYEPHADGSSYLDVSINLPKWFGLKWIDHWIFTVESIDSMIHFKSCDELSTNI